MSVNGWKLTGRLLAKHFGGLGDSIASMIANFDPETATEADRDAMAARLREVSVKYAQAKREYDREQGEVVSLEKRIEQDTLVASKLIERLEAGSVDEATVNHFCDELEAAKDQLPQEQAEAVEAKEFMDELKSIIDEMARQLEEFDANAKRIKRELEAAKAQMQRQEMRQERNEELRGLQGSGKPSTAMQALQARAQKMRDQADALKTVNEVTERPAQRQASLDDLRKSVLTEGTGKVSAADRLRGLASK